MRGKRNEERWDFYVHFWLVVETGRVWDVERVGGLRDGKVVEWNKRQVE